MCNMGNVEMVNYNLTPFFSFCLLEAYQALGGLRARG